ncbi:MAG: hypothetical protein BWY15_01964 [Firmicutes bacterium ADurb.Bin193]|nr:MAG: hypothetical protein BWY15_01964 [Firmicutes bacterium ADurb.Bin193]
MRISYNITGSARKSLVGAISQVLNAPTKYLGAPTFSYEVGNYTIDKSGTLTGPDNLDLEDALHQAGFDADGDSREYDEPDTYESGLGGMGALDEFPDIDQHHPGQYVNPNAPITEAMQRQMDEALAFEDIRMDGREEMGLGRTCRENFRGENGMQASDIPEHDILTIEMPLTGFTPEKLGNLSKLVLNKSTLIKKALGTDELPIIVTDDRVSFPWFRFEPDPAQIAAYTHFISALCNMAKVQKRVVEKETAADNEKFAFRTFLLRLGFIGPEFKEHRKVLLNNLSGSSAFRNGGDSNE